MDSSKKLELQKAAVKVRMNVIEGTFNAKSGHPGGSLSISDIMTYLYMYKMNLNPQDPKMEDRDRFVLSKGHTAPALYGALALRGFFPEEEIKTLRKADSRLQGHPSMHMTPGVDMSTGSLGQGVSVAVGMALGAKISNKTYRVYTVLGDGEIEEGQVWEAAMFAAAKKLDNLVVLDADLAAATKTGIFKKKFPEKFIDCGIAEGNMMGIAAGLAATGKTVFASSFAMFAAGRAFEQVRNSIGYPHIPVKIGATHAGISVGEDGATHQCNEDIALMRTIPGMTIINPADDVEAKAAVFAAAEFNGPVYMRFGRLATPVFNNPDTYKFEIGKGVLLKDGTDITIIATGLMAYESLLAAEELAKQGINARVINIHTIKPIDKDIIIKAAKETKKIVTVEEHSIIGGLGSAVAEVVTESCPVPVIRIGVNDKFGHSGPAKDLLKEFGLCSENIVNVVKSAL